MVQGVTVGSRLGCPPVNIRSPVYAIASTSAVCSHCGAWTHVVAIVVPPGHEVLIDTAWEHSNLAAALFYVEDLSESVQATVRELTPWYRLAPSEARAAPYWMNHCEHCGAAQDDHDLHCEPGGAFMPASTPVGDPGEGAAQIQLLDVPRRLAATAAGYAHDPPI
jgi:hypothetical protein